MRLVVVGCSGSFAGPRSPASSYLLQADDADGRTWNLVLDLGNGALGALQRHIDLDDLDAVAISHLHPDHCVDVLGLYVTRKYRPSGPYPQPLPIWGPSGMRDRLAAAYEGIGPTGMAAELDFRTVVDGLVFEVGPFVVTAVAVNHPVECYGYRVEADGVVLAFTGDTDTTPALARLLADADLALVDCAFVDGRDTTRGIHLTGSRAAQEASAAGARRLMLTHIPAWNDPEVCRAQAQEYWDGTVEVAEPDRVYPLVRPGD